MGLMDEFRKLTHPYSEDDGDYDEYDDEELPEEEPAPAPRRTFGKNNTADTPRPGSSAGRVVNINTNTQLEVVLVKPERFDQASEIADHLRNKRALVLNLEQTDKGVARRLVDFLSGCAYALDGKIKKVALSTYLITPYNVGIVGDLVEELESSGMYF